MHFPSYIALLYFLKKRTKRKSVRRKRSDYTFRFITIQGIFADISTCLAFISTVRIHWQSLIRAGQSSGNEWMNECMDGWMNEWIGFPWTVLPKTYCPAYQLTTFSRIIKLKIAQRIDAVVGHLQFPLGSTVKFEEKTNIVLEGKRQHSRQLQYGGRWQ